MVWSHFREVNFNLRIMDRMLGILKVKMSLEYPTFETAFESGLNVATGANHYSLGAVLSLEPELIMFLSNSRKKCDSMHL